MPTAKANIGDKKTLRCLCRDFGVVASATDTPSVYETPPAGEWWVSRPCALGIDTTAAIPACVQHLPLCFCPDLYLFSLVSLLLTAVAPDVSNIQPHP